MQIPFSSVGAIVTLGFLAAAELNAQRPGVTAVLATLAPAALAPGVRASVQGGSFTRDAIVEVGGLRALVLGLSYDEWGGEGGFEYLVIVLPMELRSGETSLVVTTGAGSSAPFRIVVDDYAPGLFGGFFRGGKAVNCTPADETPLPGDIVTANAVGLGPTTSRLNLSTLARPIITIGGRAAEVVASVLTSDPGWYQVSFRVPSGNGYHAVVLEIGGRKSNTLLLAVGKAVVSWGNPLGVSAPESIITAAACGGSFASTNVTSDLWNPPLSLGGTTLKLTDSLGVDRPAPLLYVSPWQVNYVVPAGTASGTATITITSAVGSISTGTLEIRTVAPQVFTVGGTPAAVLVRNRGGVQTQEQIFERTENGFVPVPIDLGAETDQVLLLLFGTGLRAAANVQVIIGDIAIVVLYAGPQNEFPGLDQVNIRLPRSLAGRRNAELRLMADGALANVTLLNFK